MKAARPAWVGGTEPPRPPQHPVGPSLGSAPSPARPGPGTRSRSGTPQQPVGAQLFPPHRLLKAEGSLTVTFISASPWCAGQENQTTEPTLVGEGVSSTTSVGHPQKLGFAAPNLCALNSADVMPSDRLSTAPGHLCFVQNRCFLGLEGDFSPLLSIFRWCSQLASCRKGRGTHRSPVSQLQLSEYRRCFLQDRARTCKCIQNNASPVKLIVSCLLNMGFFSLFLLCTVT